jgi:hypothetical protein
MTMIDGSDGDYQTDVEYQDEDIQPIESGYVSHESAFDAEFETVPAGKEAVTVDFNNEQMFAIVSALQIALGEQTVAEVLHPHNPTLDALLLTRSIMNTVGRPVVIRYTPF